MPNGIKESPCRQGRRRRGCVSLSASKQAVFLSRGMTKSEVKTCSSIASAGCMGCRCASISRYSRSFTMHQCSEVKIFPGCPSSERYMSPIWAVLKPSGYRISNSNVAGAGSCISLSMQMPSAVRTRFMPSSIPCLYMADAPSRCSAVLRMLSLTDGLISCIMGNRFKRILLRVYSSCRLVLSVT